MVTSVYIHIPFCKSKCHYCSFISFSKLNLIEDYLLSLQSEITQNYKGEQLKTLYLGGGTPSLLDSKKLSLIINNFNINKDTEITIELNPDDINEKYLLELYNLGINRLSLGCQTFDKEILKQINRRHTPEQVEFVVKLAKKIGFKNISLDFIYGLPNQTLEMFISDLKKADELNLQHISLYALKIEDGCYFAKNLPKNLADDDTQADMYLSAIDLLTNLGYEHYEVSNFAKQNKTSKHNLIYWNNDEYYGFGAGAHGYVNKIRYSNKETLENYIANPLEKLNSHYVTIQEQLEEEIFLGLRKMQGIDTNLINQKFSIDFDEKYKETISKYTKLNLLKKTNKGYCLTPNGILVSNVVLADFIE